MPQATIPEVELKQAIHTRRLVCYDVSKNNKKFWTGYALPDGRYVTEYGIVDITSSQSAPKSLGVDFATEKCDKDAKKKLNYKGDKAPYKELKILAGTSGSKRADGGSKVPQHDLVRVATEQIDTNTPDVIELIKFLVHENRHTILHNTTMSYDESAGTFSTPLGIVTPDAILDARGLLNIIAPFVTKKDYTNPALLRAVNDYLMNVPQNVGTKLDVRGLFPDSSALQRQNGILDALDASVQAVMNTPKGGKKKKSKQADEQVFQVKLHRLDDGKTMDRMRKLYHSTRKDMHVCSHLEVKSVYEVDIAKAREAFKKDGEKIGNIVEAWHGTAHSNVISILRQGLVVPPESSPHVTGRMYGPGAYGAIDSTKSLNYAYGYWSGTRNDRCFMFRMQMAMGKHHVPTGSMGHRPSGYDSIWAKAGRSGVRNDELIVPRPSQTNLLWLLEFTPGGR